MGNQTDPPDQPCNAVPELLAPAGDPAALRAALEAGADAVYFGLEVLNARRRARNFTPEELEEAVGLIREHGARAYLTLNVDLTQRELPTAGKVLELARQAGVDAVLVRDPALLALREHYPKLEFHFSTQTCMANSADVAAAAALGADRVVLARELSLEEIAAASAVPGVQTEVFVQGALCFSVSGRCLMSSWVGGHSGNRGACTSPCRVPWSIDGEPAGTPLSMHDLAAAERLDELRRAGVAALKIEGRMKNAAWVRRAAGIYRRALDGEAPAQLREEIKSLGAYTGRRMTTGYLDATRNDLTGPAAGREPSPGPSGDVLPEDVLPKDERPEDERPEDERPSGKLPSPSGRGAGGEGLVESGEQDQSSPETTYRFQMLVEQRGIACRCEHHGVVEEWSIPKTVVRRAHKAVSIGALLEFLAATPIQGRLAQAPATNAPDFLLVPRAVNALTSRIAKTIQRGRKRRDTLAEIVLPEPVRALLRAGPHCQANRKPLGDEPDRVRLDAETVESFLAAVRPAAVIVEGLVPEDVRRIKAACVPAQLIVALPPICFEEDVPKLEELVAQCARRGLTVEVNSWGGWHLARRAGARVESGPGLPVLNSLAARTLAERGIEAVTLSPEAGRRQLQDVAAACPVPCSMVVFGRPRLMVSRVRAAAGFLGRTLTDRRGTRAVAREENGLWVLRAAEPFDLRDVRNDRIRVCHLVVDLTGSPDPLRDWSPPKRRRPASRFNYERGLF